MHTTPDGHPDVERASEQMLEAIAEEDEVSAQVALTSLRLALKQARERERTDSNRVALTYLYDALSFTPRSHLMTLRAEELATFHSAIREVTKGKIASSEALSRLYDSLESATFELVPQIQDA